MTADANRPADGAGDTVAEQAGTGGGGNARFRTTLTRVLLVQLGTLLLLWLLQAAYHQ